MYYRVGVVHIPVSTSFAELESHKSIATTQRYIDINDDICSKAVVII